jgi:TPP-dependent pyruvate/acetoin dehydrogenase alpha subunit
MDESSAATAAPAPAVDRDELVALLREMLFIRRFEEQVRRSFERGEVLGTTHLCNGHEAVSVGLAGAMCPDGVVATTYRGHGHVLARGADLVAVAAELLGRASGLQAFRA